MARCESASAPARGVRQLLSSVRAMRQQAVPPTRKREERRKRRRSDAALVFPERMISSAEGLVAVAIQSQEMMRIDRRASFYVLVFRLLCVDCK